MIDSTILVRYAFYTIALGVLCAIVGFVYPGTVTARQEIFQIAMVLASGGGGFLGGMQATKPADHPTPTTPPPTPAEPKA